MRVALPFTIRSLLLVPLVAVLALVWAPAEGETSEHRLRTYARMKGIEIGAAVKPGPLQNEPIYADTLSAEFSALTPENDMRWNLIHPGQYSYNFAPADSMVDFAEAHDMKVIGHNLVEGNERDRPPPSWVTEGNFTRDELINILHDHIATVVGHYQGRVFAWNVVNEAVDNDGTLRDNIWLREIGPEYVEMAFQWAREADPGALLFYNDYALIWDTIPKYPAVYALLSDLVGRGVPIDGLGFEMHLAVAYYPSQETVIERMGEVSALGLKTYISEMDVHTIFSDLPMEEKLALQATIYESIMDACLQDGNCVGLNMWGFTDKYTWLDRFWGVPTTHPLVFDENYVPKPAYYALLYAVAPDSDEDGCVDPREDMASPDRGGGRDKHNFWDFFDANRDSAVSARDFFAVLSRFGATQEPPLSKEDALAQALEPAPAPPAYHAGHDRTSPAPGADPWDTGPPDGGIGAQDFFAALAQFGHDCQ